jgi:hypothetical protein
MVVWGTLMSSRVPPELRGRVHSLDWFVSIGLTPFLRADRAGVEGHRRRRDARAGRRPAVIVVRGALPRRGLRRDEDLHPLLGEDYAGAGASADSGSGTPAIS